jgi:4-alpha-glucanotransferase
MADLQSLLDELARRRGLGDAYYDHRGELRHFSIAARRAILQAMGVAIEDETALQAELENDSTSIAPTGNPSRCYQPAILESQRCWGLSIQLYTLKSSHNWGIGDFSDLRELIDLAAPLGCDVIGLNPLHALFPADPRHSSPYSPSSRFFLNVMYIAVEDVPEFAACAPLKSLCAEGPFQAALVGVRATGNVMYEQVATLKLCALRLLYEHFLDTHSASSARALQFEQFMANGGEWLRAHTVFDALDAHFRVTHPGGWRQWPAEYRDVASESVREFASEHEHEVRFYAYLQWLADEQLGEIQRHARELGMRIGLYGDLAVGASPDGSEVWSNQFLYVQGASIGAPPDPLALNGQDWGIPPIDPYRLRVQNFSPFMELLRANMRRVGALRIDHVMSLFRLWWVPRNFSAVEGVYVHYPLDKHMEILTAESERAKCLVIGEDLGTVPDEMRNAMEAHRLYHYKVLLFEKHGDGRFRSPGEYTRHAVATATTHDLPPLKAWWLGDDLALRDRLNLYPSPDTAQRLHEERTGDRHALLHALTAAQLWRWQESDPVPDFSPALARAIHLYLSASQAALVLIQLEDLIFMTDPVNVPGTHTEHANWQRKLASDTGAIFADDSVREVLAALNATRSTSE